MQQVVVLFLQAKLDGAEQLWGNICGLVSLAATPNAPKYINSGNNSGNELDNKSGTGYILGVGKVTSSLVVQLHSTKSKRLFKQSYFLKQTQFFP